LFIQLDFHPLFFFHIDRLFLSSASSHQH
jgi:hypothetical protein